MAINQSYLKMMTESDAADLISNDFKVLSAAAKKLAGHAVRLGSLGFGTSFLKWVASFAAMYVICLLVLDWTLWFMLSVDLGSNKLEIEHSYRAIDPLHFLHPSFNIVRHLQGREWLELLAVLIPLIVIAPSLYADTVRGEWIEHIRAAGGFRDAFIKPGGISNTVGIIILFVYPVWAIVLYIL
ncbi:unnamed protein product [Malus baccata var. baccata]